MTLETIKNTNIRSMRRAPRPEDVLREIPNTSMALVESTRNNIRNILHGEDPHRLVVVVGPCSIHDQAAAYDYANRLVPLRRRYENDLEIIMRAYPEKPRTTVGWTGLIYDPHLDGTFDIPSGIKLTRTILADVNAVGLPTAIEFLDNFSPQYTSDLVSWGAIGARTTESQTHRQLASGLSMPIGFKNSTEGDSKVAVQSMIAAQSPHSFFGLLEDGTGGIFDTNGNRDTHIVLRGGAKGPNYDAASVAQVIEIMRVLNVLEAKGRPIMIDCSHGNSMKDFKRQPLVVTDVLEQIQAGPTRIMGVMIESNIQEDRQDWAPGKVLEYGKSITDACIGWASTERVLEDLARGVSSRTNRRRIVYATV